MSGQTNYDRYVAYKAQAGLGQTASGSGATILPVTGGKGQATTNAIASNEVRRDGQSTRGRHGTRRTTGQYPGEVRIGAHDAVVAAVMRASDWAAATTVSNATTDFTAATLAVSGDTVTLTDAVGSLLTVAGGPKVGDAVTWASGVAVADRSRPLIVTGVSATTITFGEDLTTVAGPVSTWSFTVASKVVNPAAGSLVATYFTVEEHEISNDGSELFPDVRWGQLQIGMQPNGLLTINPSWTGTGAMQALTAGDAPHFTSPTEPAATAQAAAIDCRLLVGDTAIDVSSLDMTVSINLSTYDQATTKESPGVFDAAMTVTINFTCLRSDLSFVADSLDETPLSLTLLARPEDGTQGFWGFHVPNFTIPIPDKSEMSKQGGPMTQTISVPAELVGKDTAGAGHDACTVKFFRSNA